MSVKPFFPEYEEFNKVSTDATAQLSPKRLIKQQTAARVRANYLSKRQNEEEQFKSVVERKTEIDRHARDLRFKKLVGEVLPEAAGELEEVQKAAVQAKETIFDLNQKLSFNKKHQTTAAEATHRKYKANVHKPIEEKIKKEMNKETIQAIKKHVGAENNVEFTQSSIALKQKPVEEESYPFSRDIDPVNWRIIHQFSHGFTEKIPSKRVGIAGIIANEGQEVQLRGKRSFKYPPGTFPRNL
jgi:hypothetical protein